MKEKGELKFVGGVHLVVLVPVSSKHHQTLWKVTPVFIFIPIFLLTMLNLAIFEAHDLLLYKLECFIGISTKEKNRIRGLFLKSPETFRAYFGCHNSFISSQRRGSKPSNFAIPLDFLALKTC